MSRFTDQTTQPAIKRQTNDGPVLNPAFEPFRRLVIDVLAEIGGGGGGSGGPIFASSIYDASETGRTILRGSSDAGRAALGLGPAATMSVNTPGGLALFDDPRFGSGGSGGPVTVAQISDASASGRSILAGTPAQARTALGLGTAALLAVGVSGGVAAYDDPRFGAGGGGGAPSTVTASQISDGSASGRSVLTGTPEQGRMALDVQKIYANIAVLPETSLNWANHKKDHYDKLLVKVGNPSIDIWPGGGFSETDMHYGNTSCVTGAMHIPIEADQSKDSANVNLIFISAGVMGLISTAAHDAAAVGVYGQARAAVNQCRIWGANFGIDNKLDGIPAWGEPMHVNGIGCEVDVFWRQPMNKTGNSNVFGITIAGEFKDGRPAGFCSGVEVFAYNGLPWKIAYGTGHGAADKFAQISLSKKETDDGASGSQQFEFIACQSGAGASNVLRYGYLALNQVGDFLMQPNYYGQPGSLIIANANLTSNSRISAVDGFFGPAATITTLGVTGNANINGNIAAGGTVSGGALNTGGTISGRDLTLANSANISARVTSQDATVNGNLEVNSAIYCPNFFFFQGRSVSLAAAGQGPNGSQRVLVVAA